MLKQVVSTAIDSDIPLFAPELRYCPAMHQIPDGLTDEEHEAFCEKWHKDRITRGKEISCDRNKTLQF